MALLRRFQDAIERFANIVGAGFHFPQDGLKEFRNIGNFYGPGNQILRGAKNEILDDEQINLIPVGRKFSRLA